MEIIEKITERLNKIESLLEHVFVSIQAGFESKNSPKAEKTYTEKEASEYLKVTPRTMMNYRQNGLIDFHQEGRRVIYTQENLDVYLSRTKKKAYHFK